MPGPYMVRDAPAGRRMTRNGFRACKRPSWGGHSALDIATPSASVRPAAARWFALRPTCDDDAKAVSSLQIVGRGGQSARSAMQVPAAVRARSPYNPRRHSPIGRTGGLRRICCQCRNVHSPIGRNPRSHWVSSSSVAVNFRSVRRMLPSRMARIDRRCSICRQKRRRFAVAPMSVWDNCPDAAST